MENHAAYVGSWVKKLRDDKFEVFRAAKDARKMVDFLAGRLVLEPVDAPATTPATSPAVMLKPTSTPAVKALLAIKPKRAPRSSSKLGGTVPPPAMPQDAMTM